MSTIIMSACWPLQMPPTPKAVLISLADNANDQGECWPSIPKICERTCLGRTAVIDGIKWLESCGYITADRSNGRHTKYVVLVQQGMLFDTKPVRQADRSAKRTDETGAGSERDGITSSGSLTCDDAVGHFDREMPAKPVRETDGSGRQTGSPSGPNQSASRTAPVRQADSNRQEPSRTKDQKRQHPKPAEPRDDGRRGSRLPDGWTPSDEVRAWAAAEHPTVNIDEALPEFRDHWRAVAGQQGRKLDWDATFRNRVRVLAERQARNNHAASSGHRESQSERVARINREAALGKNEFGGSIIEGEARHVA